MSGNQSQHSGTVFDNYPSACDDSTCWCNEQMSHPTYYLINPNNNQKLKLHSKGQYIDFTSKGWIETCPHYIITKDDINECHKCPRVNIFTLNEDDPVESKLITIVQMLRKEKESNIKLLAEIRSLLPE